MRISPALRVGEPSFGGNAARLRLGRRTFGLPPGTRTHVVKRGQLAYVLLHGREIHALTPAGEVSIPVPLSDLILAKYFTSEQP